MDTSGRLNPELGRHRHLTPDHVAFPSAIRWGIRRRGGALQRRAAASASASASAFAFGPVLVRGLGVLLGVFLGLAHGAEAGKTVEDYARDLEGSDRALKREAAYQLSRLGGKARPALPQLVKALEDDQQQVWFGAITALANLGPDAEPALPALLAELDGWQPFRRDRQGTQGIYRTALALGAIGPAAVPGLSNRLASDKWHVRAGAARALGFATHHALPTVPALARSLRDERAEVREAAGEALVGLGRASVGPLVGILGETEETRARLAAVETLGRLGTNALTAAEALRGRVRTDPDAEVRARALVALGRVGIPRSERVAILLAARADAAAEVREAARNALLTVRPVEPEVLPALLGELKSEDSGVRTAAAELLAELGAEARAGAGVVADQLRARSKGGVPDPALVGALAGMGQAALPPVFRELEQPGRTSSGWTTNDWPMAVLRQVNVLALPGLRQALSNAVPAVRAGALEGLIGLGSQGRPAARALPRLLEDPDAGVRARAWLAAAGCGVAPDALLARLENGLKDSDGEVRRAVLKAVARLGRDAKPAVPRMVEELSSMDEGLRMAALEAVAALGPEAEAAVPILARRLEGAPAALQIQLLEALGAIGPGAGSALSPIRAIAGVDSVEVRKATLRTLGLLKESAREALPVVAEGARHADPSVRAVAVAAAVGIDASAELAITTGVKALEDEDLQVRRAAAEAMLKLQERGRPGEERLFAMIDQPGERTVALDALRAIHPVSVPALTKALGHREWRVREMAADMLARLGKDANDALPLLDKLSNEDRNEDVKRAARRATRRIRQG